MRGLFHNTVTVLGTVCIQTYRCPEVSYAVKYMCRQNPSSCLVGNQRGALRCFFLVRLINHFISPLMEPRYLPGACSPRFAGHSVPLSTRCRQTRFSEAKSPRSLFQFLLGFPKRTQCGCTIIHLSQTRVEWAGLAVAWPRHHPERADPWEPRPIRADSDVSFDQCPAPLREVDGLRRDPLRCTFVGVLLESSVHCTRRIDRLRAFSRVCGWWGMAVLRWWSDPSG